MDDLSTDIQKIYQDSYTLAMRLSQNKEKIYKVPSNAAELRLAKLIDRECREFKHKHQQFLRGKDTLSLQKLRQKRTRAKKETYPSSARIRYTVKGCLKEIAKKPVAKFYQNPEDPPLIKQIKSKKQCVPTQKLPNISMITGKLSPSLKLPGIKDYSLDLCNKSSSSLEKLKALNLALNESFEELKRLDQGNIKEYRKRTSSLNLSHRKRKFVSCDNYAGNIWKDPNTAIHNCSKNFKETQINQNNKLKTILDKVELERPFMIHKKRELISLHTNSIKLANKCYSLNKQAETHRILRIREASRQRSLYYDVLSYLNQRQNSPSIVEKDFVEAIKDILESGWPVGIKEISLISQQFSGKDEKGISDLVVFLTERLNKSDDNSNN